MRGVEGGIWRHLGIVLISSVDTCNCKTMTIEETIIATNFVAETISALVEYLAQKFLIT